MNFFLALKGADVSHRSITDAVLSVKMICVYLCEPFCVTSVRNQTRAPSEAPLVVQRFINKIIFLKI